MTGRPRRVLAPAVDAALDGDGTELDRLAALAPGDRRDAALALLAIHDLHTAPIERLGRRVEHQHHPAVAALKRRLEADVLASLDATVALPAPDADPVAAMRSLARRDLVHPVYDWLAEEATEAEMVAFLALEGGPDGGFDDLVALCQVGLGGAAKLELARNYWDEMGNGRLERVHTQLHHDLVGALDLPVVPRAEQPLAALERAVLGGLLATNRALQPEMLGALGLIELQAGPRCRRVVAGMRRLGLPAQAQEFYAEHAEADPRHGKDWLDHAITPLAEERPEWRAGIVRGAAWRSVVNARFLDDMADRFLPALAIAS